MITSLGGQSGSIGAYALLNREWYVEFSAYRVATDFFRWMSAGTAFQAGGLNYLSGYNPYWRAYWTKESGAQSFMVGTFGMHSNVYPNSAAPTGPTDVFTDYGFDSQYQYLGDTHKSTLPRELYLRASAVECEFPARRVSNSKGQPKIAEPERHLQLS